MIKHLISKLLRDVILYTSDGNTAFPKGKYVSYEQYQALEAELKSSNLKVDRLKLSLSLLKGEKNSMQEYIKELTRRITN